MASCNNNNEPGHLCPEYLIDMCVCESPLIFDECTETCVNEMDCSPSDQLKVCAQAPVNVTMDRCDAE